MFVHPNGFIGSGKKLKKHPPQQSSSNTSNDDIGIDGQCLQGLVSQRSSTQLIVTLLFGLFLLLYLSAGKGSIG
jgi:hypothetical protein